MDGTWPATFNYNNLFSIFKEVLDPLICLSSNSIVMEFMDQKGVVDLVKRFRRGGQGTFWNTLCGGGVVGGVVSDPQNGKNSKSTQGTFWRD